MSKTEFLKWLSTTRQYNLKWGLTGTGSSVRASYFGKSLWCDDAIVDYLTPLTAVLFLTTGVAFHPANDRIAGKALGLNEKELNEIIHGSDFSFPTHDIHNRTAILTAVGIKE